MSEIDDSPELAQEPGESCYAADNRLFSFGQDVLAYSLWSHKASIQPRAAVEMLAQRGRRLPQESLTSDPADLFEALTRDGLLLSPAELLARLLGSAEQETTAPVTVLTVPTCDRPELLRRCLSSYAANAQGHARRLTLVVADDSQDAGTRATNRAVAQEAATALQGGLRYVGNEEKERLVDALCRSGAAPPEVIRFGLQQESRVGRRYGANRNFLQLATTGQLVISADDDTACPAIVNHPGEESLSFESPVSNLTLRSLADGEESQLAANAVDRDFVAFHEALLGRTLGGIARQFDSAIVLGESLDHRFLRALSRGEGRVLATSFGVAGDSGMGGPHWSLLFRGQARRRLLASETTYQALCRSRRVLRSVPAYTVAGGELWMGYCVGLDNRSILPPFFPYGRNEDGVFISTALACHRSAFAGHVPAAIFHLPSDPRSYAAEDISSAFSRLRFCDLLSGLLASAPLPFPSADPAREMRRLGAWLIDVANEEGAFGEVATAACWRLQDSRLRRLEETLDEAKGPVSWRRDVESQVAGLRRALESATFPYVCDLDSSTQVRAALGEARVQLGNYGRLLHHWPEVVVASRSLMER